MEIERKFLVNKIPDNLENCDKMNFVQRYIDIGKEDHELRVRARVHKGLEDYFLTIKSGSGLARAEIEVEIPLQVYNSLFYLTKGHRIFKTRYFIDYDNRKIELDVYAGNLEGLKVAEVEFSSKQEAERFVPPSWFGREVTEDKRYKNKSLALNGKPSD
ncbi:MAG: CYTH domain-containing protein [Candidatus Pacearchaeota archaeon]